MTLPKSWQGHGHHRFWSTMLERMEQREAIGIGTKRFICANRLSDRCDLFGGVSEVENTGSIGRVYLNERLALVGSINDAALIGVRKVALMQFEYGQYAKRGSESIAEGHNFMIITMQK